MISEFELFLLSVAGKRKIGQVILSYLHYNHPTEPIDPSVLAIARKVSENKEEEMIRKTIVYAMILWLSLNTREFEPVVEDITSNEMYQKEGKFDRVLFLKTFK